MNRNRTPILIAIVIALALSFPAAIPASIHAQPDSDPVAFRDIAYIPRDANLGESDVLLDVYLPGDDSGPYPVTLLLHDYHGDKIAFRAYVRDLTANGWAVVAPNWRFSPDGFPYDAFCARAWINAQASQYDLDPSRVAVFGATLGGQIAALMGAIDDPGLFITDNCPYPVPAPPLAVGVATWGGYLGADVTLQWPGLRTRWAIFADVSPGTYNDLLDKLLIVPPLEWNSPGALGTNVREAARRFPLYWIDSADPPYLLMVGQNSYGELAREQTLFADYLAEAGVGAAVIDKSPLSHRIGALVGQLDELEGFFEASFEAASN